MRARPLRLILSAFSAVAVATPFLLVAALGLVWLLPQLTADIEARQSELAQAITNQVDGYFRHAITLADGLAYSITGLKLDEDELQHMADAQLHAGSVFSILYIVDSRDRVEVVALGGHGERRRQDLQGSDLSRNQLLLEARRKGRPVWSDTFLSAVGGGLSVALAAPAGGRIVMGEVSLDRLAELLRRIGGEQSLRLFVVDGRGQVIADRHGRYTAQQFNLSNIPLVREGINSRKLMTQQFTLEGERLIGSMVGAPTLNWSVLVAQPVREAYRQVWVTMGILTAGLLVALLGGSSAALWLAHRLADRFDSLIEHARRVEAGETGLAWPKANIVEFEELAAGLQRMSSSIQEREARLATLMGNLPGMVYRCANNREWTLYFVSDGCQGLTGYSPDELLTEGGGNLNRVIFEGDRDRVWAEAQEALAARRQYQLTYRIVTATGEQKWVSEHGKGLFAADGALLALEGVILDITEQRQADESRRRSEELARLLLDSSGEGIYGLDADGVCIFANPGSARKLGFASAEDLLGRKTHELFHHSRGDGTPYPYDECPVTRCLRSGVPTVSDSELFWPLDGPPFPVELRSHPIMDGEGKTTGAVVTFIDITERRKAEEQIRKSEENLRITLQSIGDAVVAVDAVGRVTRMNPIAEELTGWPLADALGVELDNVCPQLGSHCRTALHLPAASQSQAEEPPEQSEPALLVARNGTERLITCRTTPIRDDRGANVGAVMVFRDVTEQKRLEEQLIQAQKMESVGQLAGGVAHDFNNMLTGIIGAAELLALKMGDNPQSREYVDMIIRSAGKSADLIGKLLVFSRRGHRRNTPVDMRLVINDAIAILERSIDRRIEIRREFPPGPMVVNGDHGQLENAILNLGLNARDAMPDGGILSYTLRTRELDEQLIRTHALPLSPGPYLEIDVADTGVGMGPEVQKRIFEPFFTTKEVGRGTGLGLASVYGSIIEHGGFIRVYSEPGHGSLFRIYLPVVAREFEAPQAEAPPSVPAGKTVLLVEDEEILRDSITAILEEMGLRVMVARDGEEAVQLYGEAASSVDLVLLDIVMPRLGGRETFAALKKRNPGLRVVFTSGFPRDTSVAELLSDPCVVGFIQKPYRASELQSLLAKAFLVEG